MTGNSGPRKMTIDIYSDVMCPWCIIGYGQLQKGLAELAGEIAAEIRWRPFELNPDMPAEGEEQAGHIQRKYNRTAGQHLGKGGSGALAAGLSFAHCEGPAEAISALEELGIAQGDAILVKGSNSIGLGRLVAHFTARQ